MARVSRVKQAPDVTQAEDLLRMMTGTIAQPSDRSYQVKIGPSGLGDPCDYCVAATMAQQLDPTRATPSKGNLAAWNGTAIHKYLELLFIGEKWDAIGFRREMPKLYIGTIPGYGKIVGTADAYGEEHETVVDYKTSTLAKIRGYKTKGIPQSHDYQRDMYGRGTELKGLPVKYVANLYIPRDGFNFSDMWYDIALYDPNKADRAITRATTIFNDYVLADKIDELGVDDSCFPCNSFGHVPASPKVRVKRRTSNGN